MTVANRFSPPDPAGLRADYAALTDHQLSVCLSAAERLVAIHEALANDGSSVVAELFREEPAFHRWAHYPENDATDPQSGAMYYYHAHDEMERPEDEHGHFHSFLADPEGEGFNHVVAVSMDARGMPLSLFTTNRWVTDERIRPAGDVLARLETFSVARVRPSWLVSQWLEAVLALFRPRIEALLIQRDRVLGLEGLPDMPQSSPVLEDRGRHVVSEKAVSLFQAIEIAEAVAIDRGLA
ncbi:MAG: DUF6969 family protein [Halothiobacillaceae bacterium]